ncbi:MAG: hypothetical protein LW818_08510 [Ignavibacteriae bacterium]|jgi:hypothetical protein|nr:hypothetical protein [Ignavibacteriota bacterium]
MKSAILLSIFMCFVFASIASAVSDEKNGEYTLKSSGSHESSTGAPGERTCAQSGCHEMSEIINDDTTNTLIFSDDDGLYGNAMEGIRLRVRKEDKVKFGFQIVCLDSLNKNAGSWVLLNKERVQTQGADFSLVSAVGRSYVTHTYKGNLAQIPGEIYWDFAWLPPANGYKGKVTFYVMSNCANNDNTNAGDVFYASKHSLQHVSSMTSIEDDGQIPFKVGQDTWFLPMNVHHEIKQIRCIDIKGRVQLIDWNKNDDKGLEVTLPFSDMRGFVTLLIEFEHGITLKKHLIL